MPEQAMTRAAAIHGPEAAKDIHVALRPAGLEAAPLAPIEVGGCTGVAERLSAGRVIGDAAIAQQFLSWLTGLCRRRVAVCLTIHGLGNAAVWRDFCSLARNAIDAAGGQSGDIGFCLHSGELPIAIWCDIADSILGPGPRFAYLDVQQIPAHSGQRIAAGRQADWGVLWHSCRAGHGVAPVYGGFVRSTCPLLADEAATAVVPVSGLCAPARSAWLTLRLDLERCADDRGNLDTGRLGTALREAVLVADPLLDRQPWATATQAADARRNRRLAFLVSGIGDLVERRGANPADLGTLREFAGILGHVRCALHGASAELARLAGEVPALTDACPQGQWFDGSHGENWQRRFEAARAQWAVRHRNLLVVSPYSVLPSVSRPRPAFTDLLPLLRYADAWHFADPPPLDGWNFNNFIDFHRRARAIIQASHVTSRVAAGA